MILKVSGLFVMLFCLYVLFIVYWNFWSFFEWGGVVVVFGGFEKYWEK